MLLQLKIKLVKQLNFNKVVGFAIGPLGVALLGFISVPLLAWMFSQVDIGRLNILQMVCSFAMIVFSMGLDQAYIREYHTHKNRPLLFLQCFVPVLLVLLVISLLLPYWWESISNYLFQDGNPYLLLIVLLGVWAILLLRFFSTILRMQSRGWLFSMSQLINRVVLIAVCSFVYFFVENKNFVILALAFVSGLVVAALFAAICVRKDIGASFIAVMKGGVAQDGIALIRFGAPLALAGLCYWALTATGTFALNHLSTLQELGAYSVALSFGAAATVFQQVFTVMWAPAVYKWIDEGVGQDRFNNIAQDVLSVVVLICCLLGATIWLIDIVLPDGYSNVKYYVLCTLLPPMLYTLSEVTAIGIGISRKTWLNTVASGIALGVNTLLCWWWVPSLGACGAVIANTFAFSVYFVARTEGSCVAWQSQPRFVIYSVVGVLAIASALTAWAATLQLQWVFFAWWLLLVPALVLYGKRYKAFFDQMICRLTLVR